MGRVWPTVSIIKWYSILAISVNQNVTDIMCSVAHIISPNPHTTLCSYYLHLFR